MNYFDLCAQYLLECETKIKKERIKRKSANQKPNNYVVIDLVISPFDYLCPIILKKDVQIVLKILGKWKLNTNEKDLSERGYIDSNETYNGLPIGVLIGRNSACPEEGYFKIYNGLRYTPKQTGLLFVCFNHDWYSKLEPQGQPSLTISLTSFTEYNTIYKTIGFNILHLGDSVILEYINMARLKPKLFANIFLEHLIKYNSFISSLYNAMKEMNELPYLKENKFLTKLSLEHSIYLSQSGRVSHYDSNNRNVIKRAKENLQTLKGVQDINETFFDLKEAYTAIQSPINPLFLVLKLLIDELVPSFENRKCLLNNKIQYCGISILSHSRYENICVIYCSENEY